MKWVIGCSILFPFVMGCSTTSTIARGSGPPLEGHIVGGSPSALVIEDGGRRYAIPRSDIREIDYPGNVHAVVGGILAGYGVLNVAVGYEDCANGSGTDAQNRAYCVGLFTPGAVGLGMLIWGLVINSGAKRAASDQSLEVEAPPPFYPPPPYPPPVTAPPGFAPPHAAPPPAATAAPPPATTTPPTPATTGEPRPPPTPPAGSATEPPAPPPPSTGTFPPAQ